MKYSTARREAAEFQEDFVILVNEEIGKGNVSVGQLAAIMGVDRSAVCRSLNGKRKFTYSEVVKMSQYLGIKPEVWNTIGNPKSERGFLPLYGTVAASVWRVKGEKMTLSPIKTISTGADDTEDQFSYFVSEGLYAGEYAICLHVEDGHAPEDGDIFVVEETRTLPPANTKIWNTTLKVAQVADDKTLLVSLSEEADAGEIAYPSEGYELKAHVIGFYRQVGKKKAHCAT